MSKKSKKLLIFTVIILIIALISSYILIGKSSDAATGILPFSKKTFKEQFPQFKSIDTTKENCFDLGIESGRSNIECFIPDEFEKVSAGMENPADFKKSFAKSGLANAKELGYEHKSEFLRFFDSVQPTANGVTNRYIKIREELQKRVKSSKSTASDLGFYTYMMSIEGNYKELERYNAELCRRFSKKCEKDKITIKASGNVKDSTGIPIKGAKISHMGTSMAALTDDGGNYSLEFESFPEQKVRIEASKKGYSVGIAPFDILAAADGQILSKDFILNAPAQTASIDTKNKKIEGKGTSADNGNYIIKTQWSEYRIPKDALKRSDGEAFIGKADVYLFEFNKGTDLDDLLKNDIFDDVAGYAGNLMKTFGMPFILFVAEDGEKIHIFKNNPMILKNRIQEMEALKTNKDKIYSPLTDKDMDFLVDNTSKLGGYPIDRQFLIDNQMLRFPVFWVFDQYKGIWEAIPIKVLTREGDIESLFYTTTEKF